MSEMGLTDARLSLGRVISQTFGVTRRNIVAIGLLSFVVAVLASALGFGATTWLAAARPGDSTARATAGLESVISFILGGIATAGITHVVVSDLNGGKTGTGPAFATGLRLAVPLLGLNVIVSLGIGLAAVLLVVPGIMLALRWSVAAPVRVVEQLSISDSIRRSTELTQGNRWRLLGLFLILVTVVLLVALLIGVAIVVLNRSGTSTTAPVFEIVGNIVLGTLSAALSSTIPAVCYAELRRIREGATPRQLASVFA